MSEWRWLVALEAGLFFSGVCWETTASWAAPTYEPVPFALALVAAATVGMLTCHVGPAFYASRFAVPGWVMAWLAFGYLEWLWGMGEVAVQTFGVGQFAAMAAFVLAGCVRPVWRTVLFVSLSVSVGILGWSLQAQWRGIRATNPYFGSGQETLFESFTPGVLLAAAPAVVIAWRIGKVRPEAKSIWWSGILGVWLPALVAVAVASVATDAGATLYWRPTLFRGFYWALQGADGFNQTANLLTGVTVLAPSILSAVALRHLGSGWTGHRAMFLLPAGLWAAAWGVLQWTGPYEGLKFAFFTPIHRWWAWGVVALGAAAGLRVLFLPVSGKMEYHRRDSA